MKPDRPKSIIIEGDLRPEDTGTITERDALDMIDEGNGKTEIFAHTEEARARVLAFLTTNGYTIIENLKDDEFPFNRNVPLDPQVVTNTLGDFGRRFKCSLNGCQDLPQKVSIRLKTGKEVISMLVNLYTDGASQKDGTFYFEDNVRGEKNHFFGSEIETVTFLE